MYIALMDSENYSWIGCGQTEKKAKEAIVKEWNRSDIREKITLSELEDSYSINCYWLEDGYCVVM